MRILKFLFCFTFFILSSKISLGQSWLWGKEGTASFDGANLACDNKGNSYIAGDFHDTISFDNFHLINNNYKFFTSTYYIAKFDSSGKVIWAKQATLASINAEAQIWTTSAV